MPTAEQTKNTGESMSSQLVYPGERLRFAILAALSITFWVVLIIGTVGIALIYLLLIWLGYLFAQSAFISHLRGSAVLIGPDQFPDLHLAIEESCQKLGMKQMPDAYLLHADGLFNALATRFLGRHYIVLYSSVVDALESRPEAIRFYIGHELGHIHRKHLRWGPVLAPMAWIPLLGAAHRRAQEYTCDRYGLACSSSPEAALAGMAALAAGHSRWSALNAESFHRQCESLGGFWASFHEFVGDYPWTAKRAFALSELAADREPKQVRRSMLAAVIALFVPRVPGAGGAGFLVVVALVGILAAIAIPAYQDYLVRASAAGVMVMAQEDEALVETYAKATFEWPTELSDLGLEDPVRDLGEGAAMLSLGAEGALVYTFVDGPAQGTSLQFDPEPEIQDNQLVGLSWTCSSPDMKPGWLPASCR